MTEKKDPNRTRKLGGSIRCQKLVDGEVCDRDSNATVHRPKFGPNGVNPNYHEYKPKVDSE